MRIHPLLRTVTLLLIAIVTFGQLSGCMPDCDPALPYGMPGSCPDPSKAAGTAYGECDSWPNNYCVNSSLTCIADQCLPCGEPEEPCCQIPGGAATCEAGVSCNYYNDGYPMCTTNCGMIGKKCCGNGQCPTSGVCNNDTEMCEEDTSSSDPCSGAFPYLVWAVDAFGCAELPLSFSSNSDAEALSCAQAWLSSKDPSGTWHLGPLGAAPTCGDFCEYSINGPSTMQLCYFSESELASCEGSICVDTSSCSWSQGACP